MKSIHTANSAVLKEFEHERQDKTLFGFWVYLMTDCVLFACLFATFAVLRNNVHDGPTARDIVDLRYVLVETLVLLTSSFTCGLMVLATQRRDRSRILLWLAVTAALGALFLILEGNEFHTLAREGNSWHRSAFLTSFFTLLGTHGLHIAIGLLWMAVMAVRIIRKGVSDATVRRLALFSLFWHFLDIIWIFIFTIVYLLGARPL